MIKNKTKLINEDIQFLTVKELKQYSLNEILETLKYYYSKCEKLEDEIQYEYENSLGWDI